jgi:hypothetical protein
MSLSVKFLRELFSFPGQPDDRDVDVIIGGVSTNDIGQPGPELGTNIAVEIGLPTGYYLTTTDPLKISAPRFYPSAFIGGEFVNRWVLIQLPTGVDFGKFVPDEHSSGTWYDASAEKLASWPNWTPMPDGSNPDPHLVTTIPEPSSAPQTVTILKPVADLSSLQGLLMFALADADGVKLSFDHPEWEQYRMRASTALSTLQSVDQLRSLFPIPVNT